MGCCPRGRPPEKIVCWGLGGRELVSWGLAAGARGLGRWGAKSWFLGDWGLKGISFHYYKNRLLECDFTTRPQPFGLPPGAAIRFPAPGVRPPAPGGYPQPPRAAPNPGRCPQPPILRWLVLGAPPTPGGWGLSQPPGAEIVPSFWGQPPKISAPTKNSLCVGGVFRNPAKFKISLRVGEYCFRNTIDRREFSL